MIDETPKTPAVKWSGPNMPRTYFGLALYFGTGAFCHVWRIGNHFQTEDLRSYGWLFAWPVGLIYLVLKFIWFILPWFVGGCVALFLIGWLLVLLAPRFTSWRIRRMVRREQAKAANQ